ncbi:MAG: hypothetical protein HYS18_16015 [Burkholderiales bacterium]|nr:hypothetical protein [Burkholderiales bacterium]
MLSRTRAILVVCGILLSGCTSIVETPNVVAGIDGDRCVGFIPAVVEGLAPTNNGSLLAKAQLPSEKGGMCAAQSFTAVAPIKVYRVYDAKYPKSAYGRWWALSLPNGPKAEYRAKNAICASWSNLDRLVSCKLKLGAEIVLGTTQSVKCDDGTIFSKTAEIQVFLPNDAQNDALLVEACEDKGPWPVM